MRFRFDPCQEHQVQAVAAVVDLFRGQPRRLPGLTFVSGLSLPVVANRLDLDEPALLHNLRLVQERNGLPADPALRCIAAAVATPAGQRPVRFPNFSVEMETGTGKTYTYVRTALELSRRYGLCKFIVVVPSVAVREGVLKTLAVTADHFRTLFGGLPYRWYCYDSGQPARVREFAQAETVQLMVITLDAFNKAGNVIRQPSDRLQGEAPLHLVQATRPVLILDEPQNMEGERSIRALADLAPLLTLRYSATHRNPYNVVYRLTPYEAYRRGLVKRIEVASVSPRAAGPLIRVEAVRARKRTLTARLAVHRQRPGGAVREQVITVRPGTDLQERTGRREYAGYVVAEIRAEGPRGAGVRFANGVFLRPGEELGAGREAVWAAQIRYTVATHLERQVRLRPAGIKVLSLFFIDRVDHYARPDGIIRRLFTQAFNELKVRYPEWRDADPAAVQAGYFASRRRRDGSTQFLDSLPDRTTREDEAAYQLIMRDKERLLSLAEPVAFLFSHSALREGWDNPNIFQICTLHQTASAVKKRQEVGRGVRLAVNQEGERIWDPEVNVLTVVANESYEEYVAGLQREMEAECGPAEGPPVRPAGGNRPGPVRCAPDPGPPPPAGWAPGTARLLADSHRLAAAVVRELDRTYRPQGGVTVVPVRLEPDGAGGLRAAPAGRRAGAGPADADADRRPLPNLLGVMAEEMQTGGLPIALTRRTLLEIFRRSRHRWAALSDPYGFAAAAAAAARRVLGLERAPEPRGSQPAAVRTPTGSQTSSGRPARRGEGSSL